MIAVEITEDVDTLGGLLPRGRRLFVAGEVDEVVNLVDDQGVLRVSHCPWEKLRYVSELTGLSDPYAIFDGVRDNQMIQSDREQRSAIAE